MQCACVFACVLGGAGGKQVCVLWDSKLLARARLNSHTRGTSAMFSPRSGPPPVSRGGICLSPIGVCLLCARVYASACAERGLGRSSRN